MMTSSLRRDLGDNLILRYGTPQDAKAIAEFNGKIHSDHGPEKPDQRIAAWTSDLMRGEHPTCQASDFTLVEDIKNGQIVSTMNLISQIWSYGGVSFKVGRPELVGTLIEYRNRGLVRAQFDAIHALSAERGELLQAITGIPYYYRIFGYEMALDLEGGRAGFLPHIPKLKEKEIEPYQLRPAVEADLPFIADLHTQAEKRYLVSCLRDEKIWRYELLGSTDKNINRRELRIIETPQGDTVGYLSHPSFSWGPMMVTQDYELKPGVSWAAVTPSVIRYLQTVGETYTKESEEKEFIQSFGFWLGGEHPVYQVIPDRLPRVRPPYAFFVRVPDLPGFLRLIGPVLEKRLAESPLCGHTGEIKITFYREGVRLAFKDGKLTTAEAYQPTPVGHSGDAAFPELTFLQLLFGRRSLDDLRYIFADCWTSNDDVSVLLNILFPKCSSHVWPLS